MSPSWDWLCQVSLIWLVFFQLFFAGQNICLFWREDWLKTSGRKSLRWPRAKKFTGSRLARRNKIREQEMAATNFSEGQVNFCFHAPNLSTRTSLQDYKITAIIMIHIWLVPCRCQWTWWWRCKRCFNHLMIFCPSFLPPQTHRLSCIISFRYCWCLQHFFPVPMRNISYFTAARPWEHTHLHLVQTFVETKHPGVTSHE